MKEDIGRALDNVCSGDFPAHRFTDKDGNEWYHRGRLNLALAESKDVIVIGAEVEHVPDTKDETSPVGGATVIHTPFGKLFLFTNVGTPGPYLFFGVPKPKGEGVRQ